MPVVTGFFSLPLLFKYLHVTLFSRGPRLNISRQNGRPLPVATLLQTAPLLILHFTGTELLGFVRTHEACIGESRNLAVKSFHCHHSLKQHPLPLHLWIFHRQQKAKFPYLWRACHKLVELEPASVEPDSKEQVIILTSISQDCW